ncbi:hypothetical protein BO83DRAFT_436548 [Aspergillus eucalypticola CBS 122712]|uniref:NAD-dependent epimerase/dehydratase domain-containing protein n=1 Tax=Aspergillus eucalypticola (strain CBS 122712 / IBT 29274) TaxID=1448314 RepID=A0A317VSB1_ASPEC|nr:uncharacterized protein BO83DRAFT_436548 [Aspergillus eucalypticola CBS 122712]PWY75792.1 hypothetical protein BO83DRAFT_436548 [Aspergillus eucalypticola CBS 122712]
MSPLPQNVAFVTGANGISGYAIVEHFIRQPKLNGNHHSSLLAELQSRCPLPTPWIDPRVEFVAVDFLESVETIISKLKDICAPRVTRLFHFVRA